MKPSLIIIRMLGECVGMLNGRMWNKAKEHLTPHFAHGAAMASIPIFKAEYLRWIEQLPEDKMVSYKRSDGSGFVIDAVTACRKLPFKLIAMVLYGDMLTGKVKFFTVEASAYCITNWST